MPVAVAVVRQVLLALAVQEVAGQAQQAILTPPQQQGAQTQVEVAVVRQVGVLLVLAAQAVPASSSSAS